MRVPVRFLQLATLLAMNASAWGQSFELAEQGLTRQQGDKTPIHPVTRENGPIMVKVASFVGSYKNPDGKLFADGLTLANALVRELREDHGIDAYTFRFQIETGFRKIDEAQKDAFEERYGVRPRIFKLRTPPQENWVVLAGNFDSFEDRGAAKLLKEIQKIRPKCVSGEAKALRLSGLKGKLSTPFKTAMLVRNPVRPRGELNSDAAKEREKLFAMILELNEGQKYSLYELNAPATLMVLQYRGISVVQEKAVKEIFGKRGLKSGKSFLSEAAKRAIFATEELRRRGHEAYVFHGKFASIVCIGGYNGPQDPRIEADVKRLAQVKLPGDVQLSPKVIPVPRRPTAATRVMTE